MIRICGISSNYKFDSFSIDADGISVDEYSSYISSMKGTTSIVSSDMGEPCWIRVGKCSNNVLNMYKWGTNDVCASVRFPGDTHRVHYAVAASGTPVAFASAYNGNIVMVTNHCQAGICNSQKKIYSSLPCAIVDRTGQRMFINGNNPDIITPFGEQCPFGWWLPSTNTGLARLFAAFGDVVAYTDTNIDYIPIWDVRTAINVHKIQKPKMNHNPSTNRCAFTNEHLLTLSFDFVNNCRELGTLVFDLRNMDSYDLGYIQTKMSLYYTHAFCVCSHSESAAVKH